MLCISLLELKMASDLLEHFVPPRFGFQNGTEGIPLDYKLRTAAARHFDAQVPLTRKIRVHVGSGLLKKASNGQLREEQRSRCRGNRIRDGGPGQRIRLFTTGDIQWSDK